jgi:hypothetical protein
VLSVEYSPRPGYDASTNGVEVRINGGVVATLAADGTSLSNTAWTKHSFAFVASGPTTVEFRGVGTSDGVGSYIDDVQVLQQAAAPVPALSSTASWALVLLLAFAGAAFVRRARTAR